MWSLPPSVSKWRCEVRAYGLPFNADVKALADAVDALGLWGWLRRTGEDEPVWRGANGARIAGALPPRDRRHSGATFAYGLRHVRHMAKHGFEAWEAAVLGAGAAGAAGAGGKRLRARVSEGAHAAVAALAALLAGGRKGER